MNNDAYDDRTVNIFCIDIVKFIVYYYIELIEWSNFDDTMMLLFLIVLWNVILNWRNW